MSKKLYKGQFNHAGVTYELYTHSSSPELAFYNFMTQLHKKTEVPKRALMFWFDGSRDNYYIKEEVKKNNGRDYAKRKIRENP